MSELVNIHRLYNWTFVISLALLALAIPAGIYQSIKTSGRPPGASLRYENFIKTLHDNQDYDAEIKQRLLILHLNPENKHISHYDLARALQDQQRPGEAVYHYTESINRDQKFASAYVNRGGLYHTAGQRKYAIADYEAALAINPNLASVNYNLARALAETGNGRTAIRHYEAFVQLVENDTAPHPNLADALNRTARLLATHPNTSVRRPADAIAYAEHANELTKDRPRAIYLATLAAAYAAAGRFDDAVKAAEFAIKRAEAQGALNAAERFRQKMRLYQQRKSYLQ